MVVKTIICECGEIIHGSNFKEYIKTSANPSSRTIGHKKCGYVFNFIDKKASKKYSSKRELKILGVRFAEKNNLKDEYIGKFLAEVERLKSHENHSDCEILITAFQEVKK